MRVLRFDPGRTGSHLPHRPRYPRGRRRRTTLDNLALACVSCSLRKGARQGTPDPGDGSEVELFNPRRDTWSQHFAWNGTEVIAHTPTGKGTIVALQLNRPAVRAIPFEELLRGRHPPALND